jgi:hypothetical protein
MFRELLTHKYVYIFDKMMPCREPAGAKGFLQFSASPSYSWEALTFT